MRWIRIKDDTNVHNEESGREDVEWVNRLLSWSPVNGPIDTDARTIEQETRLSLVLTSYVGRLSTEAMCKSNEFEKESEGFPNRRYKDITGYELE